MTTASSPAMVLSPTQKKALDAILLAARSRSSPLVELRSPASLGRGQGVTSILRAVCTAMGLPLLGTGTVAGCKDQLRTLRDAALESLQQHSIAVVDDLDLAAAPHSMRRSRTLVGELKGAGEMYNIEVASAPAMLLKALADEAATSGKLIIFSTLEDAQLSFVHAPLVVTLGEPTEEDYAAVLGNRIRQLMPDSAAVAAAAAKAVYALHGQLSAAELTVHVAQMTATAAAAAQSGEDPVKNLLAVVREKLMTSSAVSPADVEDVDLSKFPGMDSIQEELEKHVIFPIEDPETATALGLCAKRGVIIHGPPGTGKTTVGRWMAHRLQGKFFHVQEMMVSSDIIKVFAAAQAAAPAVVFIDDADIVIGGWRPLDGHRGSDVFRFLLGRMDGLTSRGEKASGDVVVVLTAQRVQWMADMLLRSGRIELWLKTKLPEPRQKRDILRAYIKDDPGALSLLGVEGQQPPDVRGAAQVGDHFCCADLRRIVGDAKNQAAWDRHSNSKMKNGADYLEQAARKLKSMHSEVEENTRSIYS